MQGKVRQVGLALKGLRITPACAGKRLLISVSHVVGKDHPCVCREKLLRKALLILCLGSPLRVQGKVLISINNQNLFRITPACAGKRCWCGCQECNDKDHPCVCREKQYFPMTTWDDIGSPLRVQGKEAHYRR